MDSGAPAAGDYRPGPEVIHSLQAQCRFLLHDRAAFDDQYLVALGGLLPAGHPLHEAPGVALDLLDVVLRAVLSGEGADAAEAESRTCGEQCAALGLPDDVYPAVGRAVARAARELAGDAWSSSASSGWAAMHLWLVGNFAAGAARTRSLGGVPRGDVGGGEIAQPVAGPAPSAEGAVTGDGPMPDGPMPDGPPVADEDATAPQGRTRDRRALRGRRPKPAPAAPSAGKRAPARTPDRSDVRGSTDAISNWAFDRAGLGPDDDRTERGRGPAQDR